jgi:hypothetical protein
MGNASCYEATTVLVISELLFALFTLSANVAMAYMYLLGLFSCGCSRLEGTELINFRTSTLKIPERNLII